MAIPMKQRRKVRAVARKNCSEQILWVRNSYGRADAFSRTLRGVHRCQNFFISSVARNDNELRL
jgi:hypothetical protein